MEVPHMIVLSMVKSRRRGGKKKEKRKHWNSFREKEVN